MRRLSTLFTALVTLIAVTLPAWAVTVDLWRPGGEPAFVDARGRPYSGGKLYFYDAGTTSNRTVYRDSAGTVPHTQPIVLDSAGRLTYPVYIPIGSFKEVFKTSAGVEIYSHDSIPGAFDTTTIDVDFAKMEVPVQAKAANYTVVTADLGTLIAANANSGSVTITLPSAVTEGDGATIGVRKTDSSSNDVVIATVGGQTIDGAAGHTLTVQNEVVFLTSDGANWHAASRAVPGEDTVTAAMIAAGAVGTSEIAADGVDSSEIAANAVGNAEIRDSGALSIIGRSANSSGDPADISCTAAAGGVLRESGSTLGCGTITTAGVEDGTLTGADMASTFLDTDTSLAANSDSRVASQKATKTYVDAVATSSVKWKDPVRVATTAAGTLASDFENGDTVDGVVLATSDRILIKNQASATENGIYTVNASGAPTRATDADADAEVPGATVYVTSGTTNGSTQWTCTNTAVTLGATNISFSQIAAGLVYAADGTSLELNSTTFSIKASGVTANEIATSGVATAEILDGTIATADIGASQVTQAKLASDVQTMPIGTVFDFAASTCPSKSIAAYGQNVSRATYASLFSAIGTAHGAGDGSSTFGIPDMRGRVAIGEDDAGGATTSADRITSALNGDTHGAAGGEQSHTMTTGELVAHTHAAGTYAVGSHLHSADGTLAAASHTHTFTGTTDQATSSGGSHNHDASGWGCCDNDAQASSGTARNVSPTSETTSADGAHTHVITPAGTNSSTAPDVSGNTSSTTPSFSGSSASTGSTTAFNVVQPSIVLLKCIYTGV